MTQDIVDLRPQQLTRLFAYNALLVISDGIQARLGVTGAPFERFQPWKTVTGHEVLPESLETLIRGAFTPEVLTDLLRHFVVFEVDGPEVTKKVAAYHQYHAVQRAVRTTVEAHRTFPGSPRVQRVHHNLRSP